MLYQLTVHTTLDMVAFQETTGGMGFSDGGLASVEENHQETELKDLGQR